MSARRTTGSLLLAAAVAVLPSTAVASDLYGASQSLQLWPELDVIVPAGEAFRIIGKLEPTWIPADGNANAGVSLYGEWLVAPLTGTLLSPDLAKRRRLDVRVGISWFPTWAAGTLSWTNILKLEGEATMRTNLPGAILATLRNRVEAQWQLDEPTSFAWRLRLRPQLEREFALSEQGGSSLTPFANVEFAWTTTDDMWAQFRIQVGLQLAVHWFGAGQVLELNVMTLTNLQPSRSTAPVVGLVWYQYL